MRKIVSLMFISMVCSTSGFAQPENGSEENHRNFPLIITLQFHAFTMPFKDLKTNFRNIGVGLGTEVSFAGNNNLVQQLSISWFRNKEIGNSIFLYTHPVWRPSVATNVYSEFKLGIGYLYSFRPLASFSQKDGVWQSVGRQGKGMVAFPVGVSVGYNNYSTETYSSPFVSYQFVLVKDYNRSTPLVPNTMFQAGSRIHFK